MPGDVSSKKFQPIVGELYTLAIFLLYLDEIKQMTISLLIFMARPYMNYL